MGISERVAERHLKIRPSLGRTKIAEAGNGPPSRCIPKSHEFDERALKPLAKSLWAATVALGHTLTAYRHLSRVKSATVSPDGNLGGRGYVMGLTEMRRKLFEASESLSSISDTIFDEIKAPHWKPKLAQLDDSDQEDVGRFIDEAQEVMEDPEGDAQENLDEVAEKPIGKAEPRLESLPGSDQAQPEAEPPSLDPVLQQAKQANSSVSVGDLPGGPRVNHLGPAEGTGEYGNFVDGDGYNSEWEDALIATSLVPDSSSDSTPTEAFDFGIGFGAQGQGAGGYENPSGEGDGRSKGVEGPHSGLPGTPAPSSVDDKLNARQAQGILYGEGLLPQDATDPVSRSDYYDGPKDNMVSIGTSDLPSPDNASGVGGQPLLNTSYTQEDMSTDYVRYDYNTRSLRDRGDHPGQDYLEPFAPEEYN